MKLFSIDKLKTFGYEPNKLEAIRRNPYNTKKIKFSCNFPKVQFDIDATLDHAHGLSNRDQIKVVDKYLETDGEYEEMFDELLKLKTISKVKDYFMNRVGHNPNYRLKSRLDHMPPNDIINEKEEHEDYLWELLYTYLGSSTDYLDIEDVKNSESIESKMISDFNESKLEQYSQIEELKSIRMTSAHIIEAQVLDDSPEIIKRITSYLAGQYSDGWGEGYEQMNAFEIGSIQLESEGRSRRGSNERIKIYGTLKCWDSKQFSIRKVA